MTQTPHLILFDIDGTLVITGGAGRESTRLAMEEVFGTSSTLATHHFGGKTDWYTLVELLDLPEDEVGRIMPTYEAAVERHLSAIIDAYPVAACPGAQAAVDFLRGQPDVLLGIITGNVRTTAPVKLRAAGLDPDWFPVGAFGSEHIARESLAALALDRAQQHTGQRIPGARVTVIGDTAADVACGRHIGARVIGVSTGFAAVDELREAGPDVLLDDLTGLLPVLGY